jgi:hypothetical protein
MKLVRECTHALAPFVTTVKSGSSGFKWDGRPADQQRIDFRTQSGLSIYQPGATFYVGSCLTN